MRFTEEAHKVETNNKNDKAKTVVGSHAMPLAMDSYFDDEITSIIYMSGLTT